MPKPLMPGEEVHHALVLAAKFAFAYFLMIKVRERAAAETAAKTAEGAGAGCPLEPCRGDEALVVRGMVADVGGGSAKGQEGVAIWYSARSEALKARPKDTLQLSRHGCGARPRRPGLANGLHGTMAGRWVACNTFWSSRW